MKESFAAMFSRLAGKEEAPKESHEIELPPEPPGGMSIEPVKQKQMALSAAEERVWEKSLTLIDASMSGFELSQQELGAPTPPDRWVREFGPDKALERWNIARAGQFNKRDAPIALDIATKVHTTERRARAAEKKGHVQLNAVVAFMTVGEQPALEEREVIQVESNSKWDDVV